MIKEACVESFEKSLEAQNNGANRIELCENLAVGGTTPSYGTVKICLDLELTKELVELAAPMEVTFHKAIDEISNPLDYIEDLINIGIKRILTSGGKATALEGSDLINQMIKKANNRLKIVVAGKVTKENLNELKNLIPADEFHGKLIV